MTTKTIEERLQALEAKIAEQQETIEAMESQLETTSAELSGFRFALTRLVPFLPMTETDVSNALIRALDHAEVATEKDGMPQETKLAVFSAIQELMTLAGACGGRQHRASDSESPNE